MCTMCSMSVPSSKALSEPELDLLVLFLVRMSKFHEKFKIWFISTREEKKYFSKKDFPRCWLLILSWNLTNHCLACKKRAHDLNEYKTKSTHKMLTWNLNVFWVCFKTPLFCISTFLNILKCPIYKTILP